MDITRAVELAKKSDNEGIAYLYESTYQKSYYVALKYLKNEDMAMDVLQDSYIKAFSNIEKLENPEKFQQWISKIVANTSLNELRKNKPLLFSDTENEDGETIEWTFEDDRVEIQPEIALDKKETTRLVHEMMEELSDEQRVCITMFYMEDLSIKEISQTLEVSENTVKSRLNYGRKKIKDKVLILEKQGTKLYGIAPIPFFILLLKLDASATSVSVPAFGSIATGSAAGATSATSSATAASAGAATAGKAAGIAITAKQIIAGGITMLLIGGVAAGVVHFNRDEPQKEKPPVIEEDKEPQEEEQVIEKYPIEPSMIAVSENKVYFIDENTQGNDSIFEYNLETNEKRVVVSTKIYGQHYYSVAVNDNYLYWEESIYVEEYDYESQDSMICRADLQSFKKEELDEGYQVMVADGEVYAIMNMDDGPETENIVKYNPETKEKVALGSANGLWPYYYFYYDGQTYMINSLNANGTYNSGQEGIKAFAGDGTEVNPADYGVYGAGKETGEPLDELAANHGMEKVAAYQRLNDEYTAFYGTDAGHVHRNLYVLITNDDKEIILN